MNITTPAFSTTISIKNLPLSVSVVDKDQPIIAAAASTIEAIITVLIKNKPIHDLNVI
ncbi:conserved hypothetical protein [Ricinus communis]|uniref:Uncharacterized protein n=1 Tax=Ricinus communis TaxID=3988 RepID=B9T1B6_RICCO|nr:conserved hypothetical protein [Ricinus communis]